MLDLGVLVAFSEGGEPLGTSIGGLHFIHFDEPPHCRQLEALAGHLQTAEPMMLSSYKKRALCLNRSCLVVGPCLPEIYVAFSLLDTLSVGRAFSGCLHGYRVASYYL